MKKNIVIFFLLFIVLSSIVAQSFINPDDDFYYDVNRWEIAGYIDTIPIQRPFPAAVVKKTLETVMQTGSEKDIQKAKEYYEIFMNDSFGISLNADATAYTDNEGTDDAEAGTIVFSGVVNLQSSLSMVYDFKVTGTRRDMMVPEYGSLPYDTVDDPMSVGPFDVCINFNNLLSFGNETFGMTAGISRSSFGQFPGSSIVFDASSFHAPYIGLYLIESEWQYTQTLYSIVATDNYGEGYFTEKFLSLHDITINLLPSLSLSYYETVVFGGRFDFPYMLPCPFMISQAFGGFCDNIQMGLGFTYKPIQNLKLTADLYVDDLSANDIVKLKFDTKMIIAGQMTAQYIPEHSIFNRIYAETLLLAPRMYAHSDVSMQNDGTYHYANGRDVNYQNYTHNGESIATKIWPNSIACTLGTDMEPVHNMRLTLETKYICHANVNETIETEEAIKYLNAGNQNYPEVNCKTDGSVLNFPGFATPAPATEKDPEQNINDYPDSYVDHLPFLEQQTKMHVFQFSGGLTYSFLVNDKLKCKVSLSDTLEFIKNNGVQKEIFKSIELNGHKTSATEDDVAAALSSWRNSMNDSFKNFITISCKITF